MSKQPWHCTSRKPASRSIVRSVVNCSRVTIPRAKDGHTGFSLVPLWGADGESASWPERLGSVTLTLWLSALRASHLSDFDSH